MRIVAFAGLAFLWPLAAANLDFRGAVIVIPLNASVPERKAATMLSEEIEKRTQLRLKVQTTPVVEGPAFVLGRTDQMKSIATQFTGAPTKAEGFTFRSAPDGSRPMAVATGFDDRGVVFGTGYLLRQLRMSRQRLELEPGLNITTSPALPVRGQQLGYRPKTNAYDAWSVPMWDQYIRELAIFGTNTIELIPPRSDDADDSPHFPLHENRHDGGNVEDRPASTAWTYRSGIRRWTKTIPIQRRSSSRSRNGQRFSNACPKST